MAERIADTRIDSARRAVGYGGDAKRQFDAVAPDGEPELEIGTDDVESAYSSSIGADAAADQAALLSSVLESEAGADRERQVADVVGAQASQGASPSEFVASYGAVVDDLVDEAFDALEAGASPSEAREALRAGLRATLVDLQVAADAFADEGVESEVPLADVFEAIPYPAFLIADDHTVLAYNDPLNRLLGLDEGHREFLGEDNRETIAAATYTDGRRHRSLVDKVAENPRDAEDHWDVERVDEEYGYADRIVYEDTSVTKDKQGRETHISFLAMALFDEDGDLEAVLELVEDRSEEILHERAVTELIGEVTDTLGRIGEGDLSARATFEDEHDVVNPALLELTDDVNEMAENFQSLVERVDDRTRDLEGSIERAAESAYRIDEQVADQNDSLEAVADEISDFSATMEEVAASSDGVVEAAEDALEEADSGVEAGEDAREVTDELVETSEDLFETVEQLDEYMEEIDAVVELIDDIADQTNLLAINANIEAAKADETGASFAVVANEVKNLATETQDYTEEIADQIQLVREQADETVDGVETARERIEDVDAEIENALESFREISRQAESAATGIEEVADANDDQATTVEEVAATVEDLRSSSDAVRETTQEIVDETEQQEAAVEELAENVRKLSNSSGDREA
ncbi:methyl-accepting chemotaxis protein [Halobiforma haloterrestris]|uniref:Methyl-accepting chemotaxis protein n=1 Tax=Natronobacterium haloterrestre TaxID=148448 RepID=A0A1I1FFT2_NATHA|nr:methyl-accepting chemotaxis protein [Halobiforma haloterrestris]SFB96558.1 methyl-accepting chemotaxis protein [Halobiforma haloterrestris]